MENVANDISLLLVSVVFLASVVLSVTLFIKSCISSNSRNQSFKYMLLNVNPEIQGLKEHLKNVCGLIDSDDKLYFKANNVIIKTKHKLTNGQWRDCERFHNRLILVHQIAKTKVELSENFIDEIKNIDADGLKIKYLSKFHKEKGETERQNYRRVEIEGNWLDITLLIDSLISGNYVERDLDQGSFSLAIDVDSNRPLLKGSFSQKKCKRELKNNLTEEDFVSRHCDANKTEKLEIEDQFHEYVLKHCRDQWQRITNPKPFDCSYKAGLLSLTGQTCMVSKAVEDLANLFQNLTAELKESSYTLSDGVSVDAFKAEVNQRIAGPMKTLILQERKNSFKLLGPKNKLNKVKEMLKNLDEEMMKASTAVQPAINATAVQPTANKINGNQNRRTNEQSQLNANYNAKNSRNADRRETHVPVSAKQNRIKVSVIKGDLTKQDTDVIVNPANESLHFGGGAGKAIANAAGHQLINDCRKYIENNGVLEVGKVMHSTAGNLRPRIKYVIHAVGPSAKRYPDENTQKKIVQETFFNCYKYANDQLQAVSISVPAISSGILGIDKDIVAQAAYAALMKFEEESSNGRRTLQKVNFVNIDSESTNAFESIFKRQQSLATEMKSMEASESSKDVKRNSRNFDQPKRKRVLVQKQNPSIPVQNSAEHEVAKSSKHTLNFEKVDPASLISPANESSDDSGDSVEDCVICMDSMTDPETLPCGHKFCKSCIKSSFEMFQPKCPSCGRLFGKMRGNQPQGTMTLSISPRSLSGYEKYKTIIVQYDIPSGIQDERHPNPGQPYHGTQRHAYLPDNAEGQEVSKLLEQAFDAGLIFTVGRSSTTGRDNQVIWNDIHHKTSEIGPYGYPDPLYLSRVKEELKAKGIVPVAVGNRISAKQTVI